MNEAQLTHACMSLMGGYHPVSHQFASIRVNVVFIWGRAEGEWEDDNSNQGILRLAAMARRHYQTDYLVIPGYPGTPRERSNMLPHRHGYPGLTRWKQILIQHYKIPADKILTTSGEGTDTKTEMDNFLELCRERRWQSAIVVTQKAHALRAMLGAVQSLKEANSEVKLYPIWPIAFNWGKQVYGFQDKELKPRHQWIEEEWKRIVKYQGQGDLATFTELYEYLLGLIPA